MAKIKVGDAVKIKTCSGSSLQFYGHNKNDIGKVVEILREDKYLVEVVGRKSYSYYKPYVVYEIRDLELIPEENIPQINNNYSLY